MEYRLLKGKAMSLAIGRERYTLRVGEGSVWLTSPDDSRDYLLQKGQSFEARADGKLVLEALADSSIDIECERAGTLLQLLIQVNLRPSWNFPVTLRLLRGHTN